MAPSMVYLQCIDDYLGEGDLCSIDHWIQKLEDASLLGKWTNSQKCSITRLKCGGLARDFISSDPALEETEDWEQLKAKLVARFKEEDSTISLSQKLFIAKQQKGENVRAFASRLQQIAVRLNQSRGIPKSETERVLRREFLEADVCAVFLNGLNSEIRDWVRVQIKPKSTLSEIVRVASAEESEREMQAERQIAAVQFVRQETRRCFICQRPGHIASKCWDRFSEVPTGQWESSSDNEGSEGRHRDGSPAWQPEDDAESSQSNG